MRREWQRTDIDEYQRKNAQEMSEHRDLSAE